MKVAKFVKSASSSLVGNIILFELFAAGPLALIFFGLSFWDGTLTLGRMFHIAIVCGIFGAAMALLLWFAFVRSVVKRKQVSGQVNRQ